MIKYIPIESCGECSHVGADDCDPLCLLSEKGTYIDDINKIHPDCPLQGTCDSCKHLENDEIHRECGGIPVLCSSNYEHGLLIGDPSTMSCPAWEKK